ncbi:unnamed protein product [Spirodela intermedia]|uniref:Uncharacterized protein n=1 Tax=Spirodela intermedia TaxID=51605 RepID=A0A7I8IGY5_SPIIN|nr:unnamed protein product [Spirodela intermedia]CAA6657052.1 unnamed protein product [Spirodela intermedia]
MLKYKSEAFGQFKKFKALAKVEKNMKLKCLHSNRGGENLIGLKWILGSRKCQGDIHGISNYINALSHLNSQE